MPDPCFSSCTAESRLPACLEPSTLGCRQPTAGMRGMWVAAVHITLIVLLPRPGSPWDAEHCVRRRYKLLSDAVDPFVFR